MTVYKGINPRLHGATHWTQRMVLGQYPGVSSIHKFGRNADVGTSEEDVWNGPTAQETLLTTGTTLYISCEDNVNGVGQIIRVEGLDENFLHYNAEVTLTGQTQAQIGNANGWTRVHRAYQVSGGADPVGNCWIAESDTLTGGVPDTATKVHAVIEYTDAAQQTEKCMFTVPADHVALIHGFSASIGTPSGASRTVTVVIEVQEYDADTGLWAPFRRVDRHDLISDGQSSEHENYEIPLGPFNGKTNIHLRAVASASSIVTGDMTLSLYDTSTGTI